MNRSLLLRGVVSKDLKTLLRDRQQVFALIIGLLTVALSVGSIEISLIFEKAAKAKHEAEQKAEGTAPAKGEARPGAAATRPQGGAPANPFEKAGPSLLLWVVILCGMGVGWYASLFLLPLGFATFAGERERGTLEVILATPVPDATLYAAKSLGVTLPGVAYGMILLLLSLAYALGLHPELARVVPVSRVLLGTLLTVPLLVILCGAHVALGACCSVRAKTTQGAGMLLGGIITGAMFLLSGAGAAVFLTPARGTAVDALSWFAGLPFAVQYFAVATLLASAWVALFAIGKALFVRERMLLA